MAKPFNDKKLRLGEPLASKVQDFWAANYGAPILQLIREALEDHISRRLEEPAMKERYEAARKARLGLPEKVVKLIKNGDKPA